MKSESPVFGKDGLLKFCDDCPLSDADWRHAACGEICTTAENYAAMCDLASFTARFTFRESTGLWCCYLVRPGEDLEAFMLTKAEALMVALSKASGSTSGACQNSHQQELRAS